eukprot:CAMPEP_0117677272 /NCGR_PEP_ID=MMETSP0804-20121206/16656_1 /TAXON_ID=1074897 /ORGANISM="Tetraselmis astigmatica, Strain CCMP880" /LENGTH=85 /DNA_ID=CAMNT_0005486543 /DNA_START=51 /DNA_END=308 /DNA_ORIENTATION=+
MAALQSMALCLPAKSQLVRDGEGGAPPPLLASGEAAAVVEAWRGAAPRKVGRPHGLCSTDIPPKGSATATELRWASAAERVAQCI